MRMQTSLEAAPSGELKSSVDQGAGVIAFDIPDLKEKQNARRYAPIGAVQ